MILVVVGKKFYVASSFLTLGFISLFLVTVITGQSVLGDAGSGSIFIDIFEVMAKAVTTSLGTTGLVIMTVMGYVGYMNHIKASELFGIIVAKPLKKIKSPAVLIAGTFILAVVVKLAIPSSSSEVTLFLATIYPVLLAVGINKETAAAAFMCSMAYVWGPSNTLAYTAFNAAGLTNISIPLYFATKEIIPMAAMLAVGIVVFVLVNKYFDRKDGVVVNVDELPALKDPKDLGVPVFYAIFPILPVLFVIIFSSLVLKNVTISVVAANFMAFFIAFFTEMIRNKNIKSVMDSSKSLFEGMGKAFVDVVAILVGVNVFSAALNNLGGLNILVNAFSKIGGSEMSIVVIGCIAAFVLVGIGSSISGILPLFASIFAQFATSETVLVNMVRMLVFSGGLGSGINPVAPTTMIVSGGCDVPITTIIKRSLLPMIASLVTVIVVCLLIP